MSTPARTLRPFQAAGARWLSSRPRAILADTMGLGKTPQAIAAADMLDPHPVRILVIAPLATALGWQREVKAWATPGGAWGDGLTIIRRRDPIPAAGPARCFLPWTDLACRLGDIVAAAAWDLVVFDEAHRGKSGRRAAMAAAAWGATSRDASAPGGWKRTPGVIDRAARAWLLTGTPMPNGRPVELLPLIQAAGIVGGIGKPTPTYRKTSDYMDKHCWQPNRWTPSGKDDKGARNLDALRRALAQDGRFLRREPQDVQGELPDLIRGVVPLSGCKRIVGDDLARGMIGKAQARGRSLPAFEDMSEYRHTMGVAKVKSAADWIADHLADDPQAALVAFVWHRDVGEALSAALAQQGLEGCEVATGDDAPDARQAKVDRFAQADGPRVLVASIAACGTGMNGMQRRTATCVFVEEPWTPAECDQAEGRVRRMGSDRADKLAMAYYLTNAADILDQHIASTLADKRELVATVMSADGEAGSERSATATAAPAAPAHDPAPAPADPPAADEVAPAPESRAWSWSKDRDGEWRPRCDHEGDPEAWAGAVVVVKRRDGSGTTLALADRIACGPHGGGWSLWRAVAATGAGDADAKRLRYLSRRAQGRGLAEDHRPLTEAERASAKAAHAAACRLSDLDLDRASVRNDCGWSQADGTIGRALAGLDPGAWDAGTLALARRILGTYRRTQVADLWPGVSGEGEA